MESSKTQTKQCNKCKTIKDVIEFSRHKKTKDSLYPYCKECNKAKSRAYRKTKTGLITGIYGNQKKSSMQRSHNMPTYSKKWLTEWLYSQPKFHLLYDEWVESEYTIGLIPSIDRIDDNIGYQVDNIQLMTWHENETKGHIDVRSGKLNAIIPHKALQQFTKDGELVEEYVSLMEAGRKTEIARPSISACCSGKRKSAGGFIWEYK